MAELRNLKDEDIQKPQDMQDQPAGRHIISPKADNL